MIRRLKFLCLVVIAVAMGTAIGMTDPEQHGTEEPHSQQTLQEARSTPQLRSPRLLADQQGGQNWSPAASRIPTADTGDQAGIAPVAWLQSTLTGSEFRILSISQELVESTKVTMPVNQFDEIPFFPGKPLTIEVRFSAGDLATSKPLTSFIVSEAEPKDGVTGSTITQPDSADPTRWRVEFPNGLLFEKRTQVRFYASNGDASVNLNVFQTMRPLKTDLFVPHIGGTTHSKLRSVFESGPQTIYANGDTAFLRFNCTSPLGSSGMTAYVAKEVEGTTTVFGNVAVSAETPLDRTKSFIGSCRLPIHNLGNAEQLQVLFFSQTASGLRLVKKPVVCRIVAPEARLTLEVSEVNGDAITAAGALTQQQLESITINNKTGVTGFSGGLATDVDLVLKNRNERTGHDQLGLLERVQDADGNRLDIPDAEQIKGTGAIQTVRIDVAAYLGELVLNGESKPVDVEVLKRPLVVERITHDQVGVTAGANVIRLYFDHEQPLKLANSTINVSNTARAKEELALKNALSLVITGEPPTLEIESAKYDVSKNAIELRYKPSTLLAGTYSFKLPEGALEDVFGNQLQSYEITFGGGATGVTQNALPGSVMPGIHGSTGDYVSYQEFGPPREVPDGFNPNDKVETRVSRLYFFRDAHRVAQIINRKVESHNRHGVAVTRQLAEKARSNADELTAARQQAEREAIRRAQQTRELEAKLSDARRNFDRTLADLQQDVLARNSTEDEGQRDLLQQNIVAKENAARSFSAQVSNLESQVDSAKQAELDAREQAEQKESEEQLARQEQFRREVAAAHADPDTYAEGVPDSSDPIEQVTVSVIGEGLIHLRGPLKGVNQIRIMIDQIDSPVGQVRVNLHTTQINGDDADRLETVSSRIQTYTDQARFLTVQSSEMLRKAVMIVAAQRAEEARSLYPGGTQNERDQRYLYAFFGRDFIDELQSIDSEFLHTGNKLISLHSMDVTSLSSALMLLSLANNGTRAMILDEFDRQMHNELPLAEQKFLHAGMHRDGRRCNCLDECDECGNEKKFGNRFRRFWNKHHGPPPLYSLAQNAEFQSLKGFFDGHLPHDHTMTPLQREFVRLAQIFKSRLITELEYKQRVMERALIEDRLGNRQQELLEAQRIEDNANRLLSQANDEKGRAIERVVTELTRAQAFIRASTQEAVKNIEWFNTEYREFIRDMQRPDDRRDMREFKQSPSRFWPETYEYFGSIIDGMEFTIQKRRTEADPDQIVYVAEDDSQYRRVQAELRDAISRALWTAKSLTDFGHNAAIDIAGDGDVVQSGLSSAYAELEIVRDAIFIEPTPSDPRRMLDYDSLSQLADCMTKLERYVQDAARVQDQLSSDRIELLRMLRDPNANFEQYYLQWQLYRSQVTRIFATHPDSARVIQALERVNTQFDQLLQNDVKTSFRLREATEKRRPLDHKKFLDMLIDDLEEKYIELMEGTRAHTANIDNYLKRLTTALDDDFNTQFYYPTFRSIRESSQFKDVEFGQTETTNVLANNREFAKVSPSATMEFDLPKRDILIKEGLDSALAIYNDVGALVNDPNLMALAASQSGNSPADIGAGAAGGLGSVRSVLPGLSADTQEGIMAQASGTRPRYESNVEALIPDPAIYKFETGTGFEIRPVIEPDGQAVVFDFNYMYTTNVREPVAADEKHLGRIKRHFIDTDVQLSNFELREVSRYVVALKAERTAKGVPLLEDVPLVGALWRPLPSKEKSLQQNIIMAQATIFPTLFDLMGLRWAPSVADIDPLRLSNREFIVRGRHRFLENRVYDVSSSRVDEFLRVPESERRADLYRSQSTISSTHPNGYRGPGLDLKDSRLREGYQTERAYPDSSFVPDRSSEGALYRNNQPPVTGEMPIQPYPLESMLEEIPTAPIGEELYAPQSDFSSMLMEGR